MPPTPASAGLTITNPLVLYRALLSTRIIDPDPAQHRLALELQKLYLRLKDYSPREEYRDRLRAITRTVEKTPEPEDERQIAAPSHPLRGNPLFSHLFQRKPDRDTKALTRVLTSYETAMSLDSPRGLLLHGEVGTGKSMLVDLLADSLPNRGKRRWHFNTFMLETFARLEQLRQKRSAPGAEGDSSEHSLLWLAKDMIEKSPILFLDEFQLPDRASSKILSSLFTAFFQLGGVLVATSNRMPDELAKASGMDFAGPPQGGVMRKWLGIGGKGSIDMFPANNEYAGFVGVLKARCEIWNMEGGRDWRRREAEEMDNEAAEIAEAMREDMVDNLAGPGPAPLDRSLDEPKQAAAEDKSSTTNGITPKKYFLINTEDDASWQAAIRQALASDAPDPISWQTTTLLVYGRQVHVPRHLDGVSHWSFTELCGGAFGPADYITLASTFHTLILDHVPILTLLQKNEARRLITLLDALYEAKCKLLIRAESGPDSLFFPEIPQNGLNELDINPENDGGDAVYPETLSEVYQDSISPFRPNVSIYTDEPRRGFDADEDSDFGPIPGKGNETERQVDFGMTSSFTGEDERFAYKRARSRLWEMCGSRWHNRSEADWWRPVPVEVRRWERPSSLVTKYPLPMHGNSDVTIGESIELDKPAGLQGKEFEARENGLGPFREKRDPPSKIGGWHAWGMTKWGKKAGPWGEGPEGLGRRNK